MPARFRRLDCTRGLLPTWWAGPTTPSASNATSDWLLCQAKHPGCCNGWTIGPNDCSEGFTRGIGTSKRSTAPKPPITQHGLTEGAVMDEVRRAANRGKRRLPNNPFAAAAVVPNPAGGPSGPTAFQPLRRRHNARKRCRSRNRHRAAAGAHGRLRRDRADGIGRWRIGRARHQQGIRTRRHRGGGRSGWRRCLGRLRQSAFTVLQRGGIVRPDPAAVVDCLRAGFSSSSSNSTKRAATRPRSIRCWSSSTLPRALAPRRSNS